MAKEKILSEERLELQKGIIYGPVESRRLGKSLGINISPQEIKMCSLNCAYCQYSWTGVLVKEGSKFKKILPKTEDIEYSLRNFLRNSPKIDYLTFSGNGEPTLHPDFPKIVDIVISLREKYISKAKIACLSNSTTLDNKEIFSSLLKIDERIMKLDTGNERMFKLLNRPSTEVNFENIVSNLSAFKGDLTIQTLFVEGEIDNTKETEIISYIDKLKRIMPKKVQIYSLDRPAAYSRINEVPYAKLEKIKKMICKEVKLDILVY